MVGQLLQENNVLSENKVQPSKCENLIGFFKQLMYRAAPYLATKGCSEGLYKKEDFYRKKRVAGESLAKKRILFRPGLLLLGAKGKARFLSCRSPLLPVGSTEGPTDRLPHRC